MFNIWFQHDGFIVKLFAIVSNYNIAIVSIIIVIIIVMLVIAIVIIWERFFVRPRCILAITICYIISGKNLVFLVWCCVFVSVRRIFEKFLAMGEKQHKTRFLTDESKNHDCKYYMWS